MFMKYIKYYVITFVVACLLIFYFYVQKPEEQVLPKAISTAVVYFSDAVDEAVIDTLMSITRLSLSYRVRDEENNIFIKKYFENGNLHVESEVEFGVPSGKAVIYYENGVKKLETEFYDGQLSGLTKYYNDEGILLRDYVFNYGRVNGICHEYYLNGDMKREKPFVDGKLTGVLKTYHFGTGHLLTATQFTGNLKHGENNAYDEVGGLIWTEVFTNGIRTLRVIYDRKGRLVK